MNRRTNPYAPGAGLQPPALVGRDALLADTAIDFERLVARRPSRSLILLGLRGVGKTVLMNRLLASADALGLKTAKVEAPEGGQLPALLGPAARKVLFELDLARSAGDRIRTAFGTLRNFVGKFDVSIGDIEFGFEPMPGRADSGDLEQDLPDLLVAIGEAAVEKRTAVVLFVDEVQYLSRQELASLVVAFHELSQRNLPLMFVGAGLPQIAALAGNAKSYAERLFAYPEIGPLDPAAADAAIVEPALSEGVEFEPDALEAIRDATRHYPYFLQEWGFHVWNHAAGSPVTRADVEAVGPTVVAHLDANFFRVRFDRLTPLQQKYLRAMAELGNEPYRTTDIAGALGVESPSVATVRAQLIAKGMVWSQRHGETAFTVPLFAAFMRRQMPVLEKHVPRRRSKSARDRQG